MMRVAFESVTLISIALISIALTLAVRLQAVMRTINDGLADLRGRPFTGLLHG